jgi:hypothetical protein
MQATARFKKLLLVVLILGQIVGTTPTVAQSTGDDGSSPELPKIPENKWADLLLAVVNDPCKKEQCDPCTVTCVEKQGLIEAVFNRKSLTIDQTEWKTTANLSLGQGVGNNLIQGNEINGKLEITVSAPPTDLTPFVQLRGNTTCEHLEAQSTAWAQDPSGVLDPKSHDFLKLDDFNYSIPQMTINKRVTVTLRIVADASVKMFFFGAGVGSELIRTINYDVHADVAAYERQFNGETVAKIESEMKRDLTRKFQSLIVSYWHNLQQEIKAKSIDFNLHVGDMIYSGKDLLGQVAAAVNTRTVYDGYYYGSEVGQVKLTRPAVTKEMLGLTCEHGIE